MPETEREGAKRRHVEPVTEREVAAFVKRHRGQRAEMSVGGVAGLCARVAASGDLTYALRYRGRDRRQRTLTIGPVGLADARKRARDLLAQARVGSDPWQQQEAERMADEERRKASTRTLDAVAEAWLSKAEWRPGTQRENRRLLQRHFLPVFGARDPNTIERGEVRKVLDELSETPWEARHAHAALRALYAWLAQDRQEHFGVTSNPLRGLSMPAGERRTETYSDDQLRRILAAVRGDAIEDLLTLA